MSRVSRGTFSTGRYRWVIVVVGFIINLCLGAIYSYSVFRKPLEKLWTITSTESGLPYMAFLAAFAFVMPFAGSFIDRYGPRLTLILGSVLVTVGWIFASYSNDIYTLTLLYGVVGGAGTGTTYCVPITTAAKWFPDKSGTAIGLTVLGFGLSPLVTAPAISALIEMVGPLKTFFYLGIIILMVLVAFSFLLRFPQQELGSSSLNEGMPEKQIELGASAMLRKKSFYALWIGYAIACFSGFMAVGISAPFGIEVVKISQTEASIAVSVFAIFNGLGRPFFGMLTDRLRPRLVAVLSFCMILAASLSLYLFSEGNPIVFYVGFALLWLNLGGWITLAPTTTKMFFGAKNYGKNYGIVITADGVGALLGPLSSGWLRDTTGTYLSVFPLVAALAVVGAITMLFGLKRGD